VNLLEKQLSTVYFKDVRFSWATLYMWPHAAEQSSPTVGLSSSNLFQLSLLFFLSCYSPPLP